MSRKSVFAVAAGLLLTAPLFATSIVYVTGSDDNLYTINPTTGATTLVGSMGVEMTGLAIDPVNNAMFAVSFNGGGISTLYSVNRSTGAATSIGSTGAFLNALQFNSTGTTLYASGGTTEPCGPPPADSTTCSTFFTVSTSTGTATAVNASNNGAYDASAGLAFIGPALYITSDSSSTSGGGNDTLYSVAPGTGVGTSVGSIGFQWVFGLAYDPENTTLYGFNDVGNHVLTISTGTGAGTSIATYSGSFEITDAAELETTPEPGTWGIMTLGLGVLAGLAARKRKRA